MAVRGKLQKKDWSAARGLKLERRTAHAPPVALGINQKKMINSARWGVDKGRVPYCEVKM